MTRERKQRNNHHVKSYLSAFLIGLPLTLGTIILALLFIPKGLPQPLTLVLFFLLFSPSFIILGYALCRTLVPVIGRMPFRTVKQWVLLYPVVVGFGVFWALLAMVFEVFTPSLPREDRETTLPILIIAAIAIILSTTRLRYSVARFFNRLFGT